MKSITELNDDTLDRALASSSSPVLVDFYATWCGPCKTLAPRLDRLAGDFGSRIKFVSVNIDQAQTLAAKFSVKGIPTLIFFGRYGRVADTVVGLTSVEMLRAKMEVLAATAAGSPPPPSMLPTSSQL